ncbi:TIGR03016 family PEP-CTERM system-associated outer membrane protein [Rheinheimera maricola]|uniref:TIGR03016 family PEP-CTERM system-associated outer membrane protein n=1 Tax=Rheinheimera maricola TaxID=2793282 RepID=A0ABS7X946_9GAMM|nr:TIGR03016 family PEP-CTERM system-associated outer membrane protein [Rheinheimera maricola]MBZ9611714.1 TIGR03016 family PEP-CTERM system-associated outer membrane protein [Rheinheimera maricola]
MAMVITMAPANLFAAHCRQWPWAKLSALRLIWLVVALPTSISAADIEVKPVIETSTYGFWLREEQTGGGLDKGVAALVSPSLAVNVTGKNLSSVLFYKNEAIWYDDSQRSHKSLAQYSLSNVFTGYDGRVRFGLTADSQHQIRNSQQGVFSDIVTGGENLAKTRTHGATLDFATRRNATVNARIGLAYSDLTSEAPEADDGLADFNNKFKSADILLGTAERQSPLFWQINGNYAKTDRDEQQDFVKKRLDAIAGLPLLPHLSVIGKASYEQTNNLQQYASEFSSYGTGLELQFGRKSRINVTRNRSERTIDGPIREEIIEEEYTATEVVLAPTRRTSLSYASDKRYYGRSTEMSGEYNLRFLTMRLSVTDRVETQSFFQQTTEDLGIFVCPAGAGEFSDCFRPPTNNYELEAGESFQQWFNNDVELSDEIVKRRSENFSIGYSKNRLTLNFQLSNSDDEYVESERFSERKTQSLQSVWRLSEQSDLLLTLRNYEINYRTEQRKDRNKSLEIGVITQLNEHSDVSASVRRTSRNSSINSFDIEENRVWLTYRYNL